MFGLLNKKSFRLSGVYIFGFQIEKKKLTVEKNLKNAAIFSIILCVLNTQNVTNMTMCQIFLAQVLQIKQNITSMFRKFEAPNV